jgi:putative aldouronate transport system permease protein
MAALRLDQDTIFTVLIHIFLSLLIITIIYPLIYVVSASFSDPLSLLNGEIWLLPIRPNLEAYANVLESDQIWMGYKNTIIYTVVGTVINLVLSIMAAYPLSRRDLKGANLVMIIIVITMFFRGGIVPLYLVVKGLGLTNTFWAMVIPTGINVYNVIIMRTFFRTSIPEELKDSAFIDGCSNIAFLLRIVLPLSGSILAVMVLFYSVFHWNDFFNALIYLSDRKLFPLQLILREILLQSNVEDMMGEEAGYLEHLLRSEALKYTVIIFASLPMLILYPFIQRFFVKGVMIGAIKG